MFSRWQRIFRCKNYPNCNFVVRRQNNHKSERNIFFVSGSACGVCAAKENTKRTVGAAAGLSLLAFGASHFSELLHNIIIEEPQVAQVYSSLEESPVYNSLTSSLQEYSLNKTFIYQ